MIFCPICESDDAQFLGALGDRGHFRCHACGMVYNVSMDDVNAMVDNDALDEEEDEDEEWDGQPDEAQEWHDFDPDC